MKYFSAILLHLLNFSTCFGQVKPSLNPKMPSAEDFIVVGININPPGTFADSISNNVITSSLYTMSIEIYYKEDDFFSYPGVTAVTDMKGDTIAKGSAEYYGHIGHSSQTYHLTTNISSLPKELSYKIHFGSLNDTTFILNYSRPITSQTDTTFLLTCSDISVLGIELDTSFQESNTLLVTVHVTGNEKYAISYPCVKSVKDSLGNVIAEGENNIYGLWGNSNHTFRLKLKGKFDKTIKSYNVIISGSNSEFEYTFTRK